MTLHTIAEQTEALSRQTADEGCDLLGESECAQRHDPLLRV